MKGIIFDIKHFAVHDGPGIRQTVFLKGCPLNCKWCHNPESQSVSVDEFISEEKVGNQKFIRRKLIGQEMSVEEIINEIKKDIQFFDESGGGVTFSGGEPLMQNEFLLALAKECKKNDIHVTVDTSGFASEDTIKAIASFTDLFLYDLKLIDNHLHKEYAGVSNEIILNNLKKLDSMHSKVIIRLPLIPDVTTTPKNLGDIADLINSFEFINELNILPYHDISISKYQRFNKDYSLGKLRKMQNDEIVKIKDFFQSRGINTKIEK